MYIKTYNIIMLPHERMHSFLYAGTTVQKTQDYSGH